MLLEAGAEVDSRDIRGYTPLHVAAKTGNDANALILLDYGADCNANGINTYRKTPLHRARTPKMVQILLQAGTNTSATMSNKDKQLEREELSAFEVKIWRKYDGILE